MQKGLFKLKPVELFFLLAPILFLISMILRYHVSLPYRDDWYLAPKLEKMFSGTLTFRDLWAQHNEHRPLFPRLILLTIAALSGWNILIQELFNLGLAIAVFFLLFSLIRKTSPVVGARGVFWLSLLTSLLTFSLRQWENWTWAFEICYFLSIFSAVAGIYLLSDLTFNPKKFYGAALCGVVSLYSFMSGFIFWIAGFLLILGSRFERKRTKGFALLFWAAVTCALITLYLHDYHKPAGSPPLLFAWKHPLTGLRYFFTYLGSPVLPSPQAVYPGAAGFFLFIFLNSRLFLRADIKRDLYSGISAVGLFAVGNAIQTTLARSGYGVLQSLESRYTTVSSLFWVSFLVLGALWLQKHRGPVVSAAGKMAVAGIALIVVSIGCSSIALMKKRSDDLKKAEQALLRDGDVTLLTYDPVSKVTHTEYESFLLSSAATMKKHALASFRRGR